MSAANSYKRLPAYPTLHGLLQALCRTVQSSQAVVTGFDVGRSRPTNPRKQNAATALGPLVPNFDVNAARDCRVLGLGKASGICSLFAISWGSFLNIDHDTL